jgi:hypothetical protein
MSKDTILTLLENIPAFYNQDSDSNNYKILNSFAIELDSFITQKQKMQIAIFIDTAYGDDLDTLGRLFQLARLSNETDTAFRARIKSFWQTRVGAGTLDAIKTAVASLTTTLTPDDITIVETADKPIINVNIPLNSETLTITQQIIDIVNDTKAAGVYVGVSFTLTEGIDEEINIEDEVSTSVYEYGIFTAGVSLAGSVDVA